MEQQSILDAIKARGEGMTPKEYSNDPFILERYLSELAPKESICREVSISTYLNITLTMKQLNQPADAGGI